MVRVWRSATLLVVALVLAEPAMGSTSVALAAQGPARVASAAVSGSGSEASPGARGAGDPYFPRDGNGGFSVDHYGLDLRYRPRTGRLDGTAVVDARSTQWLSRFDLDF